MNEKELVKQMTLEEKCSLLSGGTQFTTKPVKRLSIPPVYLSDGPSGVRKQAGASDHLGLNPSEPATCWPSAATMANAWDTELEEAVGQKMGEEARALGVNVLLGPGLNMKRSPLCGRNFEYFSEDPYLAGKMAAACIRGIQSNGISACPKHFAANNQELLRMHSDSVVDERTLREIYLTGFEIAVKEGKPLCIMSSYNRINGTYASENRHLLREILIDAWGFEGFVVTDWGGSNDRPKAVKAGNHLEMPSTGGTSDREVADAVRSGTLDEAAVDRIVEEYLRVLPKIRIPKDAPTTFDKAAHHAFARKAAEAAIVLLKNQDDLLPLAKGTSVAVIGDFAQKPRYQGAGSSAVNSTMEDNPLDCLKDSGLVVTGFAKGFLRHGGEDKELVTEAVGLAAKSEAVLLYMGLDELAESEGVDRTTMKIRSSQIRLLEAVSKVNHKVIVVFCGGAPVECPWIDNCQAFVHGYLGGQAQAGALADVLTGRVNPSGKLAETWPLTYPDTPAYSYYPGKERTAEYREGLYIGYRYYDTAGRPVRFPFGYGLSYTKFAYSNLCVGPEGVTFTLENTGKRAGAEVAQVYVGAPQGVTFHPLRELKGFAKVRLDPGERREVTIPLDDKAFRYFSLQTNKWEQEGGTYRIEVGASSRDIRLSGELVLQGSGAPAFCDPRALPSYCSGRITGVSDREFELLLGHPIPPAKWDRKAPLELNDAFAQLSYAKSPLGLLVYRVLKSQVERGNKSGSPDLDALFRYNMPFRAVAKMMGGAVDMAMAEALVDVFNGHFCRGVGSFIGSLSRKRKGDRRAKKALSSGK